MGKCKDTPFPDLPARAFLPTQSKSRPTGMDGQGEGGLGGRTEEGLRAQGRSFSCPHLERGQDAGGERAASRPALRPPPPASGMRTSPQTPTTQEGSREPPTATGPARAANPHAARVRQSRGLEGRHSATRWRHALQERISGKPRADASGGQELTGRLTIARRQGLCGSPGLTSAIT